MLKVGIIGCGNIAPAYMHGSSRFPDDIQIVACADLNRARAEAFAQQYGLRALSVDDLLADEALSIIINLTIPAAHTEISLKIIDAGKHAYSEKPLALNRADGQRILAAAESRGLRVGCAPDTFLGAGGQTCRQLIDSGAIGQPVSAMAFMAGHGHESWHPNPAFYYQPGGGPLFDMGPYYLTALVNLLGPLQTISALTARAYAERVAQHEDVRGQVIPVAVDTHVASLLGFRGGVVANMVMSFDVWQHHLPRIEIHGTAGSLVVPDPNTFDGTVLIWQPETGAWRDVPLRGKTELQRGAGVADLARAIEHGEPQRASGALAYHVLDAMQAHGEAAQQQRVVVLGSTVERPAAVS